MRRCLSIIIGCWAVLVSSSPLALAAGRLEQPDSRGMVRGRVVDSTGAAVVGAQVTVTPQPSSGPATTVTNQQGDYELATTPGAFTLRIVAGGFVDAARRVTLEAATTTTSNVALEVAGIHESVSVGAIAGYSVPAVSSATRTNTPLRDVPQAVSVVSRALIDDQRMSSMADVTRYMPGVGIAQGEGNRDTPILRGNSTTSDFFVDGVRDDVQYFRDLYNVERVEALKGPNAMIFGRGGVGGVINRVSRQANWGQAREASVQVGSWGNRRFTADVGRGLNETVAIRATGVYENSDSYRDGFNLERYGFNPTVAVRLGRDTTLTGSYEYFHDDRVADRGISSFEGRPLDVDPSTFFGDPTQSQADATVNVVSGLLEHRFNPRMTLRNRLSYGSYDKFYQNVFPGAVNSAGTAVAISAYNNATERQNVFNQTDLVFSTRTGRIGHTLLVGTEFGRQDTDNFRETGYFTGLGPNVTTVLAPIASPTINMPVEFRQGATDADNQGVTTIAAAYAQDQVALSRHVEAVVGLRYDQFDSDVTNNRIGVTFKSSDGLVSPRLGLIYKPVEPLSLYGSYSLTYLPRAGEQLASLSLTNQALDPEEFRNYEVGAKWDVLPTFGVTAAVYRLDRGNVVVPDPADPTLSLLVDAQRTRGVEVGLNGNITAAWSIAGGYAYQDGEITRSISATAQAGATLAQLPAHSVSLWNKYDFTPRLAAAVGVIYRGDVYTSTDNLVVLPNWTRVDAAVYYHLTSTIRAQINVENLLDAQYYPTAHSNTNITPGSPRAVRLALTTRF
ncbi:Virulence-associated outer membrane protein Vir-90 [Luteitalea pratensis]|uniref:Virulence-associated outer membrane protein Vir-90 n=1 Tax=Luteitalea pratensis TaxID=1855912 RepID=A0A143PLN3_LUTPR|nr:TonB-dependent siderophore receptor [Luteitalea pratensis]AMY09100.1 Virulence-associated outer membrane protein Vir-90 [Luteitalea pratensis]